MRIGLITDTSMVRLPIAVDEPHPDLLALAAILVARPWATRRLTIDSGISSVFAETVGSALSIEIGPVDGALTQRRAGKRPGLMYSGGPDCMAAELLMGAELPLLHLRRVKHPRIPNRFHRSSDVLESLVLRAGERGEEVHVTRSDLEFLSAPFPMYPRWPSMMVGAVLQADQLALGGLVTGRNISGMFLGWGSSFDPHGDEESTWRTVFGAAGLDLIQPLAGATDIASKSMARQHRLYDLARSCIMGKTRRPCLRCKKCLMTELIEATISGESLGSDLDEKFSSAPSVVKFLENGPPYANQHLLEFALARLPKVEESVLAGAAVALAPDIERTGWVERYYRPALTIHVPDEYRDRVAAEIEKRMEFMSSHDEQTLQSWTARP